MIKVIERATGTEYNAKQIEGGYEIFTTDGEKFKKVKDSTFKRYFKIVKDAEPQPKAEKKEEATSTKKAAKAQPKTEPKVEEAHEELSPEKKEKMIDKIKKILKLAQDNPSMEEGLSAALQAQKLMAKYNIHEDEVTLEEIRDEITSIFSQQKHDSQLHSWRKGLASVVAKNFRCKCYLQNGDVVFRGYKEDAQIALEVYLSLYAIGDHLGSKAYMEQLNSTGSGKGAYNSFTAGFLSGVEEGLNVQCTALMIITPKEVEEEFAEFSTEFKKGRKVTLKVQDSELYKKGKEEGKAAVKARSIEKKGGKK